MWQCYKLVFQAHSPIHIGYKRLGNIQRTRYYISGRNLWGAVTKRMAQFLGTKDYVQVAEFVKENLRFGYFFPAVDPEEPLYPFFKDEELKYGAKGKTSREFERLFVRSIDLTAIDHSTISAEEGTLHELEFLSHLVSQSGEPKPVFFIGNLFFKKEANYEGKKIDWEEGEIKLSALINELSVGGERRYGFGNLTLWKGKEVNEFLNGYPLELEASEPRVKIPAKEPFLAHCQVKEGDNFKGEIEPLIGREWENKQRRGAGQKLSQPLICWVPGTWAQEEKEVKVGHFGIWEISYTPSDYCKRYKKKYGMTWAEFERKMKEGEITPPETDSLELYEWHSDTMEWEFYAKANREGA